MSVASMAQDSAIRLGNSTPTLQEVVQSAATAAAQAAKSNQSVEAAADAGMTAAKQSVAGAAPVPSSPLSELVKYIPTESLTVYIAVQAAIGERHYTATWIVVGALFIANL